MNLINIARAGVITDAPSISEAGMKILFFLLSTMGIIAIIALVLSGILYFVSIGDEKKMQLAKRAAKYAVLGIVMALGGMIVIKFFGQLFQ